MPAYSVSIYLISELRCRVWILALLFLGILAFVCYAGPALA